MKPHRKHYYRNLLFAKFNPVIKILTISDVLILSGFGLISPIFAVFLTDNLVDGNVEVAGVAAMIYLLARSIGQVPAAYIIDKVKGERDDFSAMFWGSIISSIVPLAYIFATYSWHIYIIQLVYGLAQAITYPSWFAIFTRHIDNHKEGLEWGVYSTLVDLGGAAVAGIGGVVAAQFGFQPLFILVSIMSFAGSFWLFFIKKQMNKK